MAGKQLAPRFDEETIARLDRITAAVNATLPKGSRAMDNAALVRVLVLGALDEAERRWCGGPAAPAPKATSKRSGK